MPKMKEIEIEAILWTRKREYSIVALSWEKVVSKSIRGWKSGSIIVKVFKSNKDRRKRRVKRARAKMKAENN